MSLTFKQFEALHNDLISLGITMPENPTLKDLKRELEKLSVPEKHQLKIARDTIKMSCAGALILGGPNHKQAVDIIQELTGKAVELEHSCTCLLGNK